MRPYLNGKNSEGQDMFSVPLPLDEDGMVGRECPSDDCQPRYFKIAPRKENFNNNSQLGSTAEIQEDTLFCPYCGYSANMQEYVTRDQLEWLKSMIIRDMARTVQNVFKGTFGSNQTFHGGLFSISLTYKPGTLPSVRHYAEKKLKRIIECDECGGRYAVYGVAVFCPHCGKGNLIVHLHRSVETVRALLDIKSDIEKVAGNEAGYQLLGNCLEDCVSLFEGFLRVIYSQALQKLVTDNVRLQKLSELKNSFQNIARGENIIRNDIGWELFEGFSPIDRDFVEIQFAKRHVITHNLGLVDHRYQVQAQTWRRTGQDIEISLQEVSELLTLVETTLERAISKLNKISSK